MGTWSISLAHLREYTEAFCGSIVHLVWGWLIWCHYLDCLCPAISQTSAPSLCPASVGPLSKQRCSLGAWSTSLCYAIHLQLLRGIWNPSAALLQGTFLTVLSRGHGSGSGRQSNSMYRGRCMMKRSDLHPPNYFISNATVAFWHSLVSDHSLDFSWISPWICQSSPRGRSYPQSHPSCPVWCLSGNNEHCNQICLKDTVPGTDGQALWTRADWCACATLCLCSSLMEPTVYLRGAGRFWYAIFWKKYNKILQSCSGKMFLDFGQLYWVSSSQGQEGSYSKNNTERKAAGNEVF